MCPTPKQKKQKGRRTPGGIFPGAAQASSRHVDREHLRSEWKSRIEAFRIQEKERLTEVLRTRGIAGTVKSYDPFESILEIGDERELLDLFEGDAGNLPKLASYYRRKKVPVSLAFSLHAFDGTVIALDGKSDYTSKAKSQFFEYGEPILKGIFDIWGFRLNLGRTQKIPWYRIPSSVKPFPHRRFTFALNLQGFLLWLSACYEITGQTRWVDAIVNILRDWWECVPVLDGEAGSDNTYSYHAPEMRRGITAGLAWETCQVAGRLLYWCVVFFKIRRSKRASPEFLVSLLRHIIEHVWLIYCKENNIRNSNHRFIQLTTLVVTCSLFEEIRGFKHIRNTCLREIKAYLGTFRTDSDEECRRLYSMYKGALYPDGATTEVNPMFQSVIIIGIRNVLEAFRALDRPPEIEWLRRTLARLHGWQQGIKQPDGYNPPLGQCCRRADIDREHRIIKHLLPDEPDTQRYSNRSYPPDTRKSYAGIYVMRHNTRKGLLYLMCRMGPRAYRCAPDWGHIVMYAYGAELLTIPGLASRGTVFEDYTDEYERGCGYSYNTLTIDGRKQTESDRTYRVKAPLKNVWKTRKQSDLLEGHLSYPGLGLKHSRTILFEKEIGGWLVKDRVTPLDERRRHTKKHRIRRKFQLPPQYAGTVRKRDDVVESGHDALPNLSIVFPDAGKNVRIIEGQMEPCIEGWFVLHSEAQPAPAVVHEVTCSVPVVLCSFLIPSPPHAVVNVKDRHRTRHTV